MPRSFVALACFALALLSARSAVADEGTDFFEQKIRPVLAKHCYSCHSTEARDSKKLQGALFLDNAAGVLRGGENGPAIVAGNSAESLLMRAIRHEEGEMPPDGKLPDEVIADFARWIDMGAPDPRAGDAPALAPRVIDIAEGKKWWSFQPLQTIAPPVAAEGARIAGPIDQFIVAKQREHGLTQAEPAAKEQLLRRAYYDLIGLPPTPEQIDAFAQDTSPQAFEKVIDELLASPRYGEKWARHWLDVARFAESGGYEFDGFRGGAYHYRDWVIKSLNADLPYDQFVRQQLAGDKLKTDDLQAAAATGFLVAGPYPGQTTAKTIERIRYDQLDDMLMTVGGSMLGLTLGCVRCHDHKYDPLPQTDYYSLAAALAQTGHGNRQLDPDPAATQAAWQQYQAQATSLNEAIRAFAQKDLPPRFETWRAQELPKQPDSPRWQTLEPLELTAERSWIKPQADGTLLHDGGLQPGLLMTRRGERRAIANEELYRITTATHQKNVASLRLDALTHKTLPQRGPGLNGDGSFQLVELTVTAKPLDPNVKDAPQTLKLKPVFAAFADKDQPLDNAVDGKPETAWLVRETAKRDNAAVFELEPPLAGFAGGTQLVFELKFRDVGIGRLRLSLSTEPNPATWAGDFAPQHLGEIRALLAEGGNALKETQREAVARWFAPFDAETNKLVQPQRDHVGAEPRQTLSEVYTTVAGGQDVYHLRRGEVDQKLAKMTPGVLQVLSRGDMPPAAQPLDPRVALGDWMTSVEHGAGPLLARVMVNRLWQHHFGEGIVGTPNDFGAQGDRPTHPALLEWLAAEFVRGGWKLKPLHKQIMLSAAYQQSHAASEANVKADPENKYLSRQRTRRLEAENIRDALLAIGGNLDTAMYGPSFLDNVPRRSVYLRVKRSELIPIMTMFDAPEPTQSVGERVSTTVPTQSLTMMNSPFVRQQAEKLAQRIRPAQDAPPSAAVDAAYRIALGRSPSEAERTRMTTFIDEQTQAIGGDAGQARDRALVEFCHALICLNEFVYVD